MEFTSFFRHFNTKLLTDPYPDSGFDLLASFNQFPTLFWTYFDLSDFYNIEYFNIANEYETYVLNKI